MTFEMNRLSAEPSSNGSNSLMQRSVLNYDSDLSEQPDLLKVGKVRTQPTKGGKLTADDTKGWTAEQWANFIPTGQAKRASAPDTSKPIVNTTASSVLLAKGLQNNRDKGAPSIQGAGPDGRIYVVEMRIRQYTNGKTGYYAVNGLGVVVPLGDSDKLNATTAGNVARDLIKTGALGPLYLGDQNAFKPRGVNRPLLGKSGTVVVKMTTVLQFAKPDTIVATIQARDVLQAGKRVQTGFVVTQLSRYNDNKPDKDRMDGFFFGLGEKNKGTTYGYLHAKEAKDWVVTGRDGKVIQDLAQAKQIVSGLIERGELVLGSDIVAPWKQRYDTEKEQFKVNVQKSKMTIGESKPIKYPIPGPAGMSETQKLQLMSPQDRLIYVINVAGKNLNGDALKELEALKSPESLAMMAGFAAAQFIPGVNILANVAGLVMTGKDVFETTKRVFDAAVLALTTKNPRQLEFAGEELSAAYAKGVVGVASTLVPIGVGKYVAQYTSPLMGTTPKATANRLQEVIGRYTDKDRLASPRELYEAMMAAEMAHNRKNKSAQKVTPLETATYNRLKQQAQAAINKEFGTANNPTHTNGSQAKPTRGPTVTSQPAKATVGSQLQSLTSNALKGAQAPKEVQNNFAVQLKAYAEQHLKKVNAPVTPENTVKILELLNQRPDIQKSLLDRAVTNYITRTNEGTAAKVQKTNPDGAQGIANLREGLLRSISKDYTPETIKDLLHPAASAKRLELLRYVLAEQLGGQSPMAAALNHYAVHMKWNNNDLVKLAASPERQISVMKEALVRESQYGGKPLTPEQQINLSQAIDKGLSSQPDAPAKAQYLKNLSSSSETLGGMMRGPAKPPVKQQKPPAEYPKPSTVEPAKATRVDRTSSLDENTVKKITQNTKKLQVTKLTVEKAAENFYDYTHTAPPKVGGQLQRPHQQALRAILGYDTELTGAQWVQIGAMGVKGNLKKASGSELLAKIGDDSSMSHAIYMYSHTKWNDLSLAARHQSHILLAGANIKGEVSGALINSNVKAAGNDTFKNNIQKANGEYVKQFARADFSDVVYQTNVLFVNKFAHPANVRKSYDYLSASSTKVQLADGIKSQIQMSGLLDSSHPSSQSFAKLIDDLRQGTPDNKQFIAEYKKWLSDESPNGAMGAVKGNPKEIYDVYLRTLSFLDIMQRSDLPAGETKISLRNIDENVVRLKKEGLMPDMETVREFHERAVVKEVREAVGLQEPVPVQTPNKAVTEPPPSGKDVQTGVGGGSADYPKPSSVEPAKATKPDLTDSKLLKVQKLLPPAKTLSYEDFARAADFANRGMMSKIPGMDATFLRRTPASQVGDLWVFRGDSRPPTEIIKDNGFTAKSSEIDWSSFWQNKTYPDGFISTSKSKETANGFADMHTRKNYMLDNPTETYVYVIRTPHIGIDKNRYFGVNNRNFNSKEVAVIGLIRAEDIVGYYKRDLRDKSLPVALALGMEESAFIANPYYKSDAAGKFQPVPTQNILRGRSVNTLLKTMNTVDSVEHKIAVVKKWTAQATTPQIKELENLLKSSPEGQKIWSDPVIAGSPYGAVFKRQALNTASENYPHDWQDINNVATPPAKVESRSADMQLAELTQVGDPNLGAGSAVPFSTVQGSLSSEQLAQLTVRVDAKARVHGRGGSLTTRPTLESKISSNLQDQLFSVRDNSSGQVVAAAAVGSDLIRNQQGQLFDGMKVDYLSDGSDRAAIQKLTISAYQYAIKEGKPLIIYPASEALSSKVYTPVLRNMIDTGSLKNAELLREKTRDGETFFVIRRLP